MTELRIHTIQVRYVAMVSDRLDEWQVPRSARPSSAAASLPQWAIESVDAKGVVDGQRLPLGDGHLEVMHTPGHTMGSICLRYKRYLFCGDHVLPDISPNVGGGDMRSRDLLRHYFESLRRTRAAARGDDLQVMPGHGAPWGTLAQRCDALVAHHKQRLQDVVEILRSDGEQTVYEIACRLFGEMKDFHVVLGCAEVNAHLEYLVEQGGVFGARGRFALIQADAEP